MNISGKISNWNLGSDKVIKVCQYNYPTKFANYLASSNIDSEGNFTINLNTSPVLGELDHFADSMHVSNNGVQFSKYQIVLHVLAANNEYLGNVA